MKSYTSLLVPQKELVLFSKIEKIVQEMPEIELGEDEKGEKVLISCHMIARALSRFFPVEYQDGYFGNSHEHSWLVTGTGRIIDSYPVAVIGGPILIDMEFITPWPSLYKAASLPKLNDACFLKNVGKVTEVVRQTMTTLGM